MINGREHRYKYLNARFSVLSALYFITVFTFSSFYASILTDFGYSSGFVGIVLMVMGISSIFSQMLYGYLIDKFSNFRALFIVVLSLFAGFNVLLFRFRTPGFVIAFSFFGMAPASALNGIVDSWVLKLNRQNQNAEYTIVRSVGSLTHAVGAVFIGRMLASLGNETAMYVVLAGCALLFILVLTLPNADASHTDTGMHRMTAKEIAGYLLKNKAFLLLVACNFFANITNYSTYVFFPLLIKSLGGTAFEVGLSSLVLSLSEFFVVFNFNKLAARFSAARLIGVGMIGYTIRALAISFAPSTPFAIAAGLCQAFSFALVVPGIAKYLSEMVDTRYLASAFMINGTLLSVSQIIGSPVFGAVSENIGVAGMIRVFSPFALIAGSVFLINLRQISGSPGRKIE